MQKEAPGALSIVSFLVMSTALVLTLAVAVATMVDPSFTIESYQALRHDMVTCLGTRPQP